MSDLRELLKRVENAENAWSLGGFDADLARALGAEVTTTHGRLHTAYRNIPWEDYPSTNWQSLPSWSRSLDDVVRLVGCLRPRVYWNLGVGTLRDGRTTYTADFSNGGEYAEREAATPALALIAALLKSLIEDELIAEARRENDHAV